MLHGVRRVVCGMSGGVDSAVAAALLKKQGFQVIGTFMQNWDEQDEDGSCQIRQEEDFEDAKKVCDHLRIPFTQVSFVKEYWNEVFSSLLTDYEAGLTPNPDILCNRFLKFGSFFKYARERFGADAIATGHYAQTSFGPYLENFHPDKKVRLKRALDLSKDQTLFLSSVHQEPLQRTMFPLGPLYKTQVRRIAKDLGMDFISKKKDSMGICFIGNRSFPTFISEYLKNKPGIFIDVDTGKVIGEHNGVHQWTIGQRCRIPGSLHAFYVAARDPKTQTIYAALGHNHPALFSNFIWTSSPHWICDIPSYSTKNPYQCMFKFQHKEWTLPAQIYEEEEGSKDKQEGTKIWLSMSTRALTPGQHAVFYKKDICLGSAKILWADGMKLNQIGLFRNKNSSNGLNSNISNSHDFVVNEQSSATLKIR